MVVGVMRVPSILKFACVVSPRTQTVSPSTPPGVDLTDQSRRPMHGSEKRKGRWTGTAEKTNTRQTRRLRRDALHCQHGLGASGVHRHLTTQLSGRQLLAVLPCHLLAA